MTHPLPAQVCTGRGAVPCNGDKASNKTGSVLAAGGLSSAGKGGSSFVRIEGERGLRYLQRSMMIDMINLYYVLRAYPISLIHRFTELRIVAQKTSKSIFLQNTFHLKLISFSSFVKIKKKYDRYFEIRCKTFQP